MELLDHTAGRLARIACFGLAAYSAWAQTAQYVGSGTCKTCHAGVYARWQKTRMANIVVDPKQHPEAIIPDSPSPIRSSLSPRTTSLSLMAASGSSVTSKKSVTTIFRCPLNGM